MIYDNVNDDEEEELEKENYSNNAEYAVEQQKQYSKNDVLTKVLFDKVVTIKSASGTSCLTQYQEIVEQPSLVSSWYSSEEVDDDDDNNNNNNNKLWGILQLQGQYNDQRESVTINFIKLNPSSKSIKLDRCHFFTIRTINFAPHKWRSGHFLVHSEDSQQPPVRKWLIENVKINKLKEISFKIKLYREKIHTRKRLIAATEISLIDLCINNKGVSSISLPRCHFDKVKIKMSQKDMKRNKEKKENNLKNHNDDELDSALPSYLQTYDDLMDDVQINILMPPDPKPEILLGFEYNPKIAILTVSIQEIFDPTIDEHKYYHLYFTIKLKPENVTNIIQSIKCDNSPFKVKKTRFKIVPNMLNVGTLKVSGYTSKRTRKKYVVIINRADDEHWLSMGMQDISYRWHELLRN